MAPWQPVALERLQPDVARRAAADELVYVAVDDLEAGVAGLVISRWPQLDDQGRLRFEQDDDLLLTVDADRLHAMLREERAPLAEGASEETEDRLRERELLVGDVFAARLLERPRRDPEGMQDPARWLAAPLVDVSEEARAAAKAQYYAAVAGVLTPAQLDRIFEEFSGEEGPDDTEPDRGPDERGGPPAGPRGAGPGGSPLPSPDPAVEGRQMVAPWQPVELQRLRPDLADLVEAGEMVYVVVDDLDVGVAGLVVSRWPWLDDQGRLCFVLEDDLPLTVDAERLHAMLREEREPLVEGVSKEAEGQVRERPLLVGDVFAARLRARPEPDLEGLQEPSRWLAGPFVDLSAEARAAAKAQYFAAVAGVLTPEQLDGIFEEFLGGEEPEDPQRPDEGGGPSRPPPAPSADRGGLGLRLRRDEESTASEAAPSAELEA